MNDQGPEIEAAKKRLREDTRATRGFNLLQNIYSFTQDDIRWLQKVLPPMILPHWYATDGEKIRLTRQDYRAAAKRVKKLSGELDKLPHTGNYTGNLIKKAVPLLDEIAMSLRGDIDLDLEPDIDPAFFALTGKRDKTKAKGKRTFAVRRVFHYIKFLHADNRRKGKDCPAIEKYPVEAIRDIVEALLNLPPGSLATSDVSRTLNK